MFHIAKGICTDTYHANSTFLCLETSTKVFMIAAVEAEHATVHCMGKNNVVFYSEHTPADAILHDEKHIVCVVPHTN